MDIWGRIYLDHWRGEPHPHRFVRDDGNSNLVESAEGYFVAPRGSVDRAALEPLEGTVLDLGCGPGSYSLFLQERGVDVVAIDSSVRAIAVCEERGCRDARVMSFGELRLEPDTFDAIICMGNTLGIGQSPDSLSDFLLQLRRLTRESGRLLVAMIDPLDTTDPEHLRYHDHNRSSGRPPGLVRTRIEYRDEAEEWWDLWMPTADEMVQVAVGGGWRIDSVVPAGASRLYDLRPAVRL